MATANRSLKRRFNYVSAIKEEPRIGGGWRDRVRLIESWWSRCWEFSVERCDWVSRCPSMFLCIDSRCGNESD